MPPSVLCRRAFATVSGHRHSPRHRGGGVASRREGCGNVSCDARRGLSLRAAHRSLRAGRRATMAESKSKKQLEVDDVETKLENLYINMSESKDAKLLGALAFIKNTLVGDLLNELGRSSTKKSLSSGQQLPGIVKAEMIEECLIVAGGLQQLATKLVMHKNRVDYDVKLTLERLIKLKIEPSSGRKPKARPVVWGCVESLSTMTYPVGGLCYTALSPRYPHRSTNTTTVGPG